MASQSTSSKALLYFSERVEDATEAVKGLLSGRGNAAGAARRYDAFGGGSASSASGYLDTSDDVLRAQLESDGDDLRINGLRTVISHISKGRDASGYFASVIKLSSNQNLEIRKLVYCIVRRYARKQPNVALLGINSFQRDLLDRNEVIRMMALRVLTGLRLKVAASVVEYAISRSVRDSSAHVRRAAALSLIKCKDLAAISGTRSAHRGYLEILLQDRNPTVLGAAVVAWKELYPQDTSMLHQHLRKLCYALGDMDEWAQHEVIIVLGVYAKRCLGRAQEIDKLDQDYSLLLGKLKDLLSSRNAAVAVSVIQVLLSIGHGQNMREIAFAATRLLHGSSEVAFCALILCATLAREHADALAQHVYSFLPRSSAFEPGYVTLLKLSILTDLASEDTFDDVLTEILEQGQNHPDTAVASRAVACIVDLAKKGSEAQRRNCVRELLRLVSDRDASPRLVGEAIEAIASLVEMSSDDDAAIIVHHLSSLLFSSQSTTPKDGTKSVKLVGKSALRDVRSRALVFQLLSLHCRLEVPLLDSQSDSSRMMLAEICGLDTVRLASLNFAREGTYAKLQIINLSTKIVTILPALNHNVALSHSVTKIHAYIMQLARYDEDFDVRDRARLCKSLTDRLSAPPEQNGETRPDSADPTGEDERLGGVILRRDQVEHILFAGKDAKFGNQKVAGTSENQDIYDTIFGQKAAGALLPSLIDFAKEPWAKEEDLPPAIVRDPPAVEAQDSEKRFDTETPALMRSISSADFSTAGSGAQNNAAASKVDLLRQNSMHTDTQKGASEKYKDLDDFLDASSESEETATSAEESDRSEDEVEEQSEEEEEQESTDEESESDDEGSDSEEDENSSSRPLRLPSDEQNAWAS